jgi:TRAP-type C4-dicarboxylate transport system substrate-binding protein
MRPVAFIGIFWLFAAVVQATAAAVSGPAPLQLALVAPPGDDHLARAAARRLQQNAAEGNLELVVETASLTEGAGSEPDLFLMPVRSLATQVPALQVLELPFLFPSLEAVHPAVDDELGALLAREARARGWEILAWWDEGMHVLSGLKRYDRVRNLKIREFLVTRPDPVAEKQFDYWKAYTRRIDPQDREAVLRECLIASRAATLQEIVVVAPGDRWAGLDGQTRQQLQAALATTTAWQRADARQREAAALAELQRMGMTIYEVDEAERAAFCRTWPGCCPTRWMHRPEKHSSGWHQPEQQLSPDPLPALRRRSRAATRRQMPMPARAMSAITDAWLRSAPTVGCSRSPASSRSRLRTGSNTGSKPGSSQALTSTPASMAARISEVAYRMTMRLPIVL